MYEHVSDLLGQILRIWMLGNSTYFLKNHQTVLLSCCTILYSHRKVSVTVALHPQLHAVQCINQNSEMSFQESHPVVIKSKANVYTAVKTL